MSQIIINTHIKEHFNIYEVRLMIIKKPVEILFIRVLLY
jgi:hypothetical protein